MPLTRTLLETWNHPALSFYALKQQIKSNLLLFLFNSLYQDILSTQSPKFLAKYPTISWMSRFNLAKKLLPAKKAWKSFKTKFQSKLQKLKTSKAIKRTKKYCIHTLNSIRVFIPCKLYALINRSPLRSRLRFYHHDHQHTGSSSAIYVDALFPGHARHYSSLAKMVASSSSAGNKVKLEETTSSNVVKKHHQIAAPGLKILEKKIKGGETSTSAAASAADAWKIPLSPHLRCVDERAEDFISKFHQEMKLEREQSIIDFHEMLARGT